MGFPLILLAFGSIFVGYLFKDLIIGPGSIFLSTIILLNPKFLNLNDAEFLSIFIKLIPLFVTLLGLIFFILILMF
jgi:NADH-ubiquinone oxidoreductase chain 5